MKAPSSKSNASASGRSAAADALSEVLAQVVPHPAIALLRSSSLSSLVQQDIEQMIVKGQLVGGDKLNEAVLAERLGVSRGPVREAFRVLEEAGLLRQEKNRGVFVRDIPIDEASEIYDLRAVMDELAGRRMAESATALQIADLRQLVEQMAQAVHAKDADAYHRLNLEFHDRLIDGCGNRKMASIYRKLVRELALFRRRNLSDAASLPTSIAEHRQILKSIAAGDAEVAGRRLYRHVMRSKDQMLAAAAAAAPAMPRGRNA